MLPITMALIPQLCFITAISLSANSWSQPPEPPVTRLLNAAKTLRRHVIISEKLIYGLETGLPKKKKTVPAATRHLDWISSTIVRKDISGRLKKVSANLLKAQTSLSSVQEKCEGLKIKSWVTVLGADEQLAQDIKTLGKLKTQLEQLQNENLGEKALKNLIQQLKKKDLNQAKDLLALSNAIQTQFSSSAIYLKKGLMAPGLAEAGRLSQAHNAYCKVQAPVQPMKAPNLEKNAGNMPRSLQEQKNLSDKFKNYTMEDWKKYNEKQNALLTQMLATGQAKVEGPADVYKNLVHTQKNPNTCAIVAQQQILQKWGIDISGKTPKEEEETLILESQAKGIYDPSRSGINGGDIGDGAYRPLETLLGAFGRLA